MQRLHVTQHRHKNLKLGRRVFPGRDLDLEDDDSNYVPTETPDCEKIHDPDRTYLLLWLAGLRTLTCDMEKHPFEFKEVSACYIIVIFVILNEIPFGAIAW